MKTFTKSIERNLSADVLVVGGGVGGCAAAIAAARNGAKVILAEEAGCLGGQAGFGLVTPVGSVVTMSGKSFGGLVEEIWQNVKEETTKYCVHNPQHEDSFIASPHILKYVLLKLATDAGVDVRFHTTLIDAISENGKVTEAIFADRSGLVSISAKIFIDGTGDGNLIALSGADYVIGSEEDAYASLKDNGLDRVHCQEGTYESSKEKALQPVSIFFTMGNVDMEKAMSYNNKALKYEDLGITKEEFKKWKFAGTCGFEDNGDLIPMPQGRILVSYSPVEGVAVLNMSRVVGIDGSDAASLSEGEIKAQLQLIAIVDFLKTFVPAFKDSYLIQSACSLGIRETRRLAGVETLKGGDVITAKQIENPIARGSYIIDIHDPKGKSMAIGGAIKGDFYDIPYGAIVSQNRSNLFACGRCISADHVAHSSSRIQGTCVMTGQAAGTAAAMCAGNNISPKDLSEVCLKQKLIDDGVYLN